MQSLEDAEAVRPAVYSKRGFGLEIANMLSFRYATRAGPVSF